MLIMNYNKLFESNCNPKPVNLTVIYLPNLSINSESMERV